MTKKIDSINDYISASNAAAILSEKLGRPIKPSYIHKLRNVRFIVINRTTKLYHRADIEAAVIRSRPGRMQKLPKGYSHDCTQLP